MDYKQIKEKLEELKVDITWSISTFICFLDRLIHFIPVIWNDRDWDYGAIYAYLKVKLDRLHKEIKNDNIHIDSQKRAKEIRLCLLHLDRYLNWDNYKEFPMDDMKLLDPAVEIKKENERKRKEAIAFEDKNYRLFWKNFVHWHRGWWS